MRSPGDLVAAARATGLPLGPLVQPLPYRQIISLRGDSKLHSSRCSHLKGRRASVAHVLAERIPPDQMCRTCADVLPAAGQAHLALLDAVVAVRQYKQPAMAKTRTWADLASLLVTIDLLEKAAASPALGEDSRSLRRLAETEHRTAEQARGRLAAHLPAPDIAGTPGQAGGPVVALDGAYRPRTPFAPSREEVIYAWSQILVRDVHHEAAYALLPYQPTDPVLYLKTVPAQPGDDAHVFATALALADLAGTMNTNMWWQRDNELKRALQLARLIHAAPSGVAHAA